MGEQKLWNAIKITKSIIEDDIYREDDERIREGLQKALDVLEDKTNPRDFLRKLNCGCLMEGEYIREYISPQKHEDWCPSCHRLERKWAWDNQVETSWGRKRREALEAHCRERKEAPHDHQ
jgi:hypothetical protein